MKFWGVALALPLLVSAPAQQSPAPAPFKTSLSPHDAESWIPFENKNGLIVIDVLLDGKPAKALVDSGLTMVALSKDYATAHGLRLAAAGSANSPGGTIEMQRTAAPVLHFGGLTTTGGEMKVVDLSAMSKQLGVPIDIGIGLPIIRGLTLQVDSDKKRLRFLSPGSRPFDGVQVPVKEAAGRLLIPLTLGDGPSHLAVIDLGQDSDLAISDATAAALPAKMLSTDIAVGSVGGIRIMRLMSIDHGAIGKAPFGPTIAQVEANGGYLAARKLAASIGMGLLSRYNFALDVRTGSLILARRATADPAPPKSTVGVQVSYLPDRLSILHVMKNSPAAAAGLKQGDAICALDGGKITPDWQSGPYGKWSTGAPGKRHNLSLCDGRAVSLTTRAFY